MQKDIFCPDCEERIEKKLTRLSGRIVCESCRAKLLVLSGGLSDCHYAVVFFFESQKICGNCLCNCSLIATQQIAA